MIGDAARPRRRARVATMPAHRRAGSAACRQSGALRVLDSAAPVNFN